MILPTSKMILKMQKIIVSDTSCLIILQKINKLELLKDVFGKIAITQIIADEFSEPLPNFIEIINPKDINYQKILENYIDAGEASAIALALDFEDSLLIIDDLKGRKQAKSLGLNITGTFGVLVLAKEKGYISSVTEIIKLIEETNFRVNQILIKELKRICNE